MDTQEVKKTKKKKKSVGLSAAAAPVDSIQTTLPPAGVQPSPTDLTGTKQKKKRKHKELTEVSIVPEPATSSLPAPAEGIPVKQTKKRKGTASKQPPAEVATETPLSAQPQAPLHTKQKKQKVKVTPDTVGSAGDGIDKATAALIQQSQSDPTLDEPAKKKRKKKHSAADAKPAEGAVSASAPAPLPTTDLVASAAAAAAGQPKGGHKKSKVKDQAAENGQAAPAAVVPKLLVPIQVIQAKKSATGPAAVANSTAAPSEKKKKKPKAKAYEVHAAAVQEVDADLALKADPVFAPVPADALQADAGSPNDAAALSPQVKQNGMAKRTGSGGPGRAFQRVNAEEWLGQKGSWDNSYNATFGESGWGAKAQDRLGQVRGKDFRHEKTKKKRGTYRGGAIDHGVRSFKYDSD